MTAAASSSSLNPLASYRKPFANAWARGSPPFRTRRHDIAASSPDDVLLQFPIAFPSASSPLRRTAASGTSPGEASGRMPPTRLSACWQLLVNPDGAWQGGDWRSVVSAAAAAPDVAACTCRQIDGSGRLAFNAGRFRSAARRLANDLSGRRASQRIRAPGWYDRQHDDVDWAIGAFLLMRTKALEELGGLDERYFLFVEDVDIGRAIRERGLRMRYVPEFSFQHIGGDMNTPFRSAHWCRSDLIYVGKWEGGTAVLAARALWALRALRALTGVGHTPLSRGTAPAVLRVALGGAPPAPTGRESLRR